MEPLQTIYNFNIRFSEIDAMKVVWHGSYVKYFEDAREAFGNQYDIGYKQIVDNGYYAPIIDLSIKFKKPLRYGMNPIMIITYQPTEAAKMIFDYEIRDERTEEIMITGHSVQVFVNFKYELEIINPLFYDNWKKKHIKE